MRANNGTIECIGTIGFSDLYKATRRDGMTGNFSSVKEAKRWITMYNGHKNWNHWNVSLWINNDEGLYNLARKSIRIAPTRLLAAKYMLQDLKAGVAMPNEERGNTPKTPDGAPYSISSIRAAMRGM